MKIRFSIAPDFCREQFLAGYEVAPQYELDCPLGALTPSERLFIVNSYPPEIEGVIYDMLLEVPVFDTHQKAIIRTPWMCRANPEVLGARGVIKEWMKDYSHHEQEAGEALVTAQEQQKPTANTPAPAKEKASRTARYKHH